MVEKPITADPEQRAHNVRVSREQSGLPPEEEQQQDDSRDKWHPTDESRESSEDTSEL